MKKLHIAPDRNTPEIIFSPEENIFSISGMSAPEDVRALYYPVIDWFRKFAAEQLANEKSLFSGQNPLKFILYLKYFNSSSAKFLFDLLMEIKQLTDKGLAAEIEWHYDEDDRELREAGYDLSVIADIDFTFIKRKNDITT